VFSCIFDTYCMQVRNVNICFYIPLCIKIIYSIVELLKLDKSKIPEASATITSYLQLAICYAHASRMQFVCTSVNNHEV
jgi:hypothetical protein